MRAFLLALALAAGCAPESFDSLVPFVCPRDHLCPTGFVCQTGVCSQEFPCDPGDATSCQDAPDGRTRCTVVALTTSTFGAQCVKPASATGAVGSNCNLTYTGWINTPSDVLVNPLQFFDNDRFCAPGNICHGLDMRPAATNTPDASIACRRLCSSDSGCGGSNEFCMDAFNRQVMPTGTMVGNKGGVCLASCTLFTDAACGNGLTCGPAPDVDGQTFRAVCHGSTAGFPAGSTCHGYNGCEAGTHCVPEGSASVCRKLCDASHPCQTGTCDTSLRLPGGAGTCR